MMIPTLSIVEDQSFRLALEVCPIPLLLVSGDGTILYANNLASLLFESSEMVGTTVDNLLPESLRDKHKSYRHSYMKEPTQREMGGKRALFARRFSGETFPVEVGLNPVQGGEHSMVLCSVIDISERKRMEREREELLAHTMEEQRLKSLGVLAGGIAHDFNNLLVGIMGNASFASALLDSDHPARECLDDVQLASQKAADLAQQMLAYSGKGRFVIEPLNLSDTVREMSGLLRSSMPGHVSLKLSLSSQLPMFEADINQIRQVVMNLITNAIESIEPPSGTVRIRTDTVWVDRDYLRQMDFTTLTEGRYILFEISDTGCGMSSETKQKMFEPFFTTKNTGHGLGLAATLGIVRGHKGALQVYSEPEQGTAIKLLFPTIKNDASEEKTIQKGGYLLIAEDNLIVQRLLNRILRWAGYEILMANDGLEAIELFKNHGSMIRLVLLDMSMPRMDGKEAFQHIRSINPSIPILLSSGFNEQEATTHLSGQNLTGFIQKPYRKDTLLKIIQQTLDEM
ncbi:MAG: response regulator [Myxococcota bacterium]|nr:response regulator [Myxococcota bacterium]